MKKIKKVITYMATVSLCIASLAQTQEVSALDNGAVAKKVTSTLEGQTKSLTPTPENAFSVTTNSTLGNYIYKYDVTIGGTEVVIPDTIGGKKIQTISTNVFNKKGLTSVYIPDGITAIGDNAFSNNSIKELRLPETLLTLGKNVFYSNQIESLTIPDSLETMDIAAFSTCGAKNVKLPDSLKTIPASAFSANKIEEIIIPDSVESIETMAFKGNLSLSKVHLSENLLTIGTYAFQLGKIEELYMGKKVQTIESNAFADNKIKEITLPDSLLTIEDSAFSSNKLTSLEIPNSVTVLGTHAFAGNTINSLKISSGITTIPQNCFGNNLLKTIDIPSNITQIDSNAFNTNLLLSIDLPDTVTTLAADAFGTQKVNTGLTKKDGINIKRMSQIYEDADQLRQIRKATSSWGTYNSTTNEMELNRDLSKDMDIIKYNYHIENSTISSDTALYIRLLFNTTYDYQVTFKDSDGTVLKTQYVEQGEAAQAPEQPIPPSNKVFSEWDTDFSDVTSELTVTAVYDTKKHDVNFMNTDETILSSVKVEHDAAVSEPKNISKPGYTLQGWFTDKLHNTAWDFTNNKIIADTNIYAKWGINQYTAKFDGNDGTDGTAITKDYNGKLGNLPDSQREGYTFQGWFTDKVNGSKIDENTIMPKDGATYYAHWQIKQYTVRFDGNGGKDGTAITKDYNQKLGNLPDSQREGYTFQGWFTDKVNGSKIDENTVMPKDGATYYARWKGVISTVTFIDNKQTISSAEVQYNTKYGTLPTRTKNGYIFKGWYNATDGQGSLILNTTIVEEKVNHNLYAYWKKVDFNHSIGSITVDGGEDVRYEIKIENQNMDSFNQNDNLLSVYDIYFTMNDQRVNIGNKKMMITLYLKEQEKYYDHYQVVYLDTNGQIAETYTPSVESDFSALKFEVSHLSYYGIVAWDDSKNPIPVDQNENFKKSEKILTNDTSNIAFYAALSSISLLLIAVVLYFKSMNRDNQKQ